MVMFALIRAHDPKWRCEAVGKVYHLYPGTVPMRALGRQLENMAAPQASEDLQASPQVKVPVAPAFSPRCHFYAEGDEAQDAIHQIREQDAIYQSGVGNGKQSRTAGGLTPSFPNVNITWSYCSFDV